MKFYLLTYSVNFRMGQITIELYWNHAPETCRNFAELCRRGYYNNTKFHRIIRNFMIQGKSLMFIKILNKGKLIFSLRLGKINE